MQFFLYFDIIVFVKGKDENNNFIFEESDIHHITNVMR